MVRDPRPSEGSSEAISIVGAGMKFVGECETEGSIRVEGTFEGSIRSSGEVVVGPNGTIKGDVRAREAVIAGTVQGTLIAESRLELRESSRLDGEVYAGRIRVGDGAVVNAALRMGDEAIAAVLREKSAGRTLRLEHGAGAQKEPNAPVEDQDELEHSVKRRTS